MNKQDKQELQKWFKQSLDVINKKLHVVKELEERFDSKVNTTFNALFDNRVSDINKGKITYISESDLIKLKNQLNSAIEHSSNAEVISQAAQELLKQAMAVKDVVKNQERFNNLFESFGNAQTALDVLQDLQAWQVSSRRMHDMETRLEKLEQKKWYQFWR